MAKFPWQAIEHAIDKLDGKKEEKAPINRRLDQADNRLAAMEEQLREDGNDPVADVVAFWRQLLTYGPTRRYEHNGRPVSVYELHFFD